MKKISKILIIIGIFLLTGCGNEGIARGALEKRYGEEFEVRSIYTDVVNSLSCHHSNLSGCHNPAHLSVTDSCRPLMIGRSFFYKVKIGNGISFLHTS